MSHSLRGSLSNCKQMIDIVKCAMLTCLLLFGVCWMFFDTVDFYFLGQGFKIVINVPYLCALKHRLKTFYLIDNTKSSYHVYCVPVYHFVMYP